MYVKITSLMTRLLLVIVMLLLDYASHSHVRGTSYHVHDGRRITHWLRAHAVYCVTMRR